MRELGARCFGIRQLNIRSSASRGPTNIDYSRCFWSFIFVFHRFTMKDDAGCDQPLPSLPNILTPWSLRPVTPSSLGLESLDSFKKKGGMTFGITIFFQINVFFIENLQLWIKCVRVSLSYGKLKRGNKKSKKSATSNTVDRENKIFPS